VHSNELVAFIRDLMIIIVSGILIVLLLATGLFLFRLYRRLNQIARNIEEVSSIVLNNVVRPVVTVGSVMEVVNRLLGRGQQQQSPEGRSGNEETKNL
jgi:hypothetical protein